MIFMIDGVLVCARFTVNFPAEADVCSAQQPPSPPYSRRDLQRSRLIATHMQDSFVQIRGLKNAQYAP